MGFCSLSLRRGRRYWPFPRVPTGMLTAHEVLSPESQCLPSGGMRSGWALTGFSGRMGFCSLSLRRGHRSRSFPRVPTRTLTAHEVLSPGNQCSPSAGMRCGYALADFSGRMGFCYLSLGRGRRSRSFPRVPTRMLTAHEVLSLESQCSPGGGMRGGHALADFSGRMGFCSLSLRRGRRSRRRKPGRRRLVFGGGHGGRSNRSPPRDSVQTP